MDAFGRALAFVLAREGGYSNDPADPGGATYHGVTQRVYDAFRRKLGKPVRDVRQMDYVEERAIYERGYWAPSGAARLATEGAERLAIVVFDTAVNMGLLRASNFLVACGYPEVPEPDAITAYLAARRLKYLALVDRNPKLGKFAKGWRNRVNLLADYVGADEAA